MAQLWDHLTLGEQIPAIEPLPLHFDEGYDTILVEHEKPLFTRKTDTKFQRIEPDFTVKIPFEVSEKLNWSVGTEIRIDVLDETLGQAIIFRKLKGEDAVKALEKLEHILTSD